MGRHTLAREITIVLVAKAVLLASGFWLFFGPEQRLDVTPELIRDHLSPTASDSRDFRGLEDRS